MSRYSRWDGTQDPFGPDLAVDDLADQLAEDVLDGWGIDNALRRLLQEGMKGRFDGLRRLRERIEELRAAQQARSGRQDPLGEFRRRLDDLLALEQEALALDPTDEARVAELDLATLPENLGERIRSLDEHEWRSPQAKEAFDRLVEDIRRQVLDAAFKGLSEGMQDLSPEDLVRAKNMLADLNRMLEQRASGIGPSQADFDRFMQEHGEFFPENPRDLDELLAAMAQRSAAMSRLMASLTPEQRAELQSTMEGMLSDLDLAFEMDRLSGNLRQLAPGLAWDEPVAGDGPPLGLREGLDAIESAATLDELEKALAQDYPGARLEDVDTEDLRRVLGDEAARDLGRLQAIEKALEDAGVISRSQGRVELTPRGVRKLGERALVRVFERLSFDRAGSHDTRVAGGGDEPTGASRPWVFGDPLRVDLRKTLHNAVLRSGAGTPIKLALEDFEVEEAEQRTSVATVLLLDMSRSMPLRGHWLPAKRMALALHTLVSTTYPEDHLAIVGFSDYARRMTPADLAEIDWEPVYGTNMEHAFNLAGRILAKHGEASKQVLLVTDGEPTAHLEGDQVYFNWPPVKATLDKTFAEAVRLARSGVTMNIFMLENEPGLAHFVDRLARMVHGRVFSTTGDRLGDLVVSDYLRR